MPTIESFEETTVWKDARKLTKLIYGHSSGGTFSRDFGLHDQMRRASVSIMSNIAEGFERDGRRELIYFLSIAKGSCGEVRSQLFVALDAGYVSDSSHREMLELACGISRQLNGWITYLRQSRFRGRKFVAS